MAEQKTGTHRLTFILYLQYRSKKFFGNEKSR